MIADIFIDRPRLAVVIALVTTLVGGLALLRIPVAQLPDIVPPQVRVSTTYPGASAEVLESTVAQPIEAKVVGVDKMIYMKSYERQRRLLHARRLLRARQQSRHQHRQRQQPGAERAVATAGRGAAAGRQRAEALVVDAAGHQHVQRRSANTTSCS